MDRKLKKIIKMGSISNMVSISSVMGEICNYEPISIYVVIFGSLICLGGVVSYIPQYYSLIRAKNPDGINEFSFLILNIGSASLAANSLILNWWKFPCFLQCDFGLCLENFVPVIQIFIAWMVVIPLYVIFVRYKIRTSDRKKLYDLAYILIYIVFILMMVIVGLSEKLASPDNKLFFRIYAKVLGVVSAVSSSVVWIPQIYTLIKKKKAGNLSLVMFAIQTPGNGIIILLQILYEQDWTTWIAYAVTLVEQLIILIILIIYRCQKRDNLILEISDEEADILFLSDTEPDTEADLVDPGLNQVTIQS